MLGTGIMCGSWIQTFCCNEHFLSIGLKVWLFTSCAETILKVLRWVGISDYNTVNTLYVATWSAAFILQGTNAVKRRVAVVNGKVEARPIMPASCCSCTRQAFLQPYSLVAIKCYTSCFFWFLKALCWKTVRYTALNYDHRLIDGREAVTFLCSVRDKLEDHKMPRILWQSLCHFVYETHTQCNIYVYLQIIYMYLLIHLF